MNATMNRYLRVILDEHDISSACHIVNNEKGIFDVVGKVVIPRVADNISKLGHALVAYEHFFELSHEEVKYTIFEEFDLQQFDVWAKERYKDGPLKFYVDDGHYCMAIGNEGVDGYLVLRRKDPFKFLFESSSILVSVYMEKKQSSLNQVPDVDRNKEIIENPVFGYKLARAMFSRSKYSPNYKNWKIIYEEWESPLCEMIFSFAVPVQMENHKVAKKHQRFLYPEDAVKYIENYIAEENKLKATSESKTTLEKMDQLPPAQVIATGDQVFFESPKNDTAYILLVVVIGLIAMAVMLS